MTGRRSRRSHTSRCAVAVVAGLSMVLAGSSFVITPAGASTRAASATGASVCVPTVEGPVTTAPPAFVAVFQPKLPAGWVDEDFFISCASKQLTYKTAVFVRRPADPKQASGVVAVDPLHSAGLWGMQALIGPYFLAHDIVQVGVAASNDTAERLLKGANPARYATLSVPATPDAPNEILAGVGALLHQRPSPLVRGVRVKAAILGGWSQSSVVTRTFISSPQARAVIGGHRPFDGFLPSQPAVGSSGRAQVGRLPDIGVRTIELQGERELLVTLSIYGKLGYRRPDSKTYRLYEVAGMSHINNEPDSPVSGFTGSLSCDWPAGAKPSAFRQTDIWAMAFDSLVRWMETGHAPPRAPRIELLPDGKTVKRDAQGNVIGGVRSVFVDVPTAGITATSLAPGGVVMNPCAYAGYQLDLSQQQLRQLYGTHAGYVRQVTKDTAKLVRERFLLPADARALVVAARESNVLG